MKVAHAPGFVGGFPGRQLAKLALIDRRAAQEPRFAIVVVADDLEHERADFIPVLHEREDQPVRPIELRAVESFVTLELFDLGCAKVPASDGCSCALVLILEARSIEVGVFEDPHGRLTF